MCVCACACASPSTIPLVAGPPPARNAKPFRSPPSPRGSQATTDHHRGPPTGRTQRHHPLCCVGAHNWRDKKRSSSWLHPVEVIRVRGEAKPESDPYRLERTCFRAKLCHMGLLNSWFRSNLLYLRMQQTAQVYLFQIICSRCSNKKIRSKMEILLRSDEISSLCVAKERARGDTHTSSAGRKPKDQQRGRGERETHTGRKAEPSFLHTEAPWERSTRCLT